MAAAVEQFAFGKIVKGFAVFSAVCQVVCAGCHLYNQLRYVHLDWNDGDDFTGETTYAWRSVFNFAPTTIVLIWTPVIFAVLAVSQFVRGLQYLKLCATYTRTCVFHTIMCMFGAFGYAGNLGICVGSVHAITAFLALLCVCMFKGKDHNIETQNILV